MSDGNISLTFTSQPRHQLLSEVEVQLQRDVVRLLPACELESAVSVQAQRPDGRHRQQQGHDEEEAAGDDLYELHGFKPRAWFRHCLVVATAELDRYQCADRVKVYGAEPPTGLQTNYSLRVSLPLFFF